MTREFWFTPDTKPQCKVYKTAQNKRWQAANKEKHRALVDAYVEKNRDHLRRKAAEYYQRTKAKKLARQNVRERQKRATDVEFRLASSLRARLRGALKRGQKQGSFVRDLGCSLTELRTHLESQFEPGMSWSNYGTEWHLDHILPLANYQLSDRGTFRRLAHYTNLQPLWAQANRIKSNHE